MTTIFVFRMMKFQMVQCYSVPTGKVFLMRSPSEASLTSIEVADINDMSTKRRYFVDDDDVDDDPTLIDATFFARNRSEDNYIKNFSTTFQLL